jgi:hypothetical protein
MADSFALETGKMKASTWAFDVAKAAAVKTR